MHQLYLVAIFLLVLRCVHLHLKVKAARSQYFKQSESYGQLYSQIRAILGCPRSTRDQLIIAVKIAAAKSGELDRIKDHLDRVAAPGPIKHDSLSLADRVASLCAMHTRASQLTRTNLVCKNFQSNARSGFTGRCANCGCLEGFHANG